MAFFVFYLEIIYHSNTLTTAGKIRVLMLVVSIALFVTALVVQKSYTPLNSLKQTAGDLEHNLHKKEQDVNSLLNDKSSFNKLKNLSEEPVNALQLIQDFTTEKNIWFITITDGRLSFWSGVKIIPDYPSDIKDGYSFLKGPNGYYEVIKKTDGGFSVLFFIPVKINYSIQSEYLKNTFSADLIKDNNIEIAGANDKNIYPIHSVDNTPLFSVKLKQGDINRGFMYYEIVIWVLTLLSLCVLIHNVCNYITEKGYIFVSLVVLALFIVIVRFINLKYGWPDLTYRLGIFSPAFYGSSFVFPSLGDFCINILYIFWFVSFIYSRRKKLLKNAPHKIAGYGIFIGCTAALLFLAALLLNLFYGLVISSKISFDVSNVLNLSAFSLLGVLMLCFSFLIFYLATESFLTVSVKLNIANSHKLYVFIAAVVLATVISALRDGLTLFYLLGGIFIFIRAYAYAYSEGRLDSISFTLIILICAFISSIKLSNFEVIKEAETRKEFIQKLEIPIDASAEVIFKKAEKQIMIDSSIIHYFTDTLHSSNFVKTRLQKLYFSDYLSKYQFTVHEFDKMDQPLSADKNYSLSVFKDLVLFSSYRVSDFFIGKTGLSAFSTILPFFPSHKKIKTSALL